MSKTEPPTRHNVYCILCGGPGVLGDTGAETNPLVKLKERAGWIHAKMPCPPRQLRLFTERRETK